MKRCREQAILGSYNEAFKNFKKAMQVIEK